MFCRLYIKDLDCSRLWVYFAAFSGSPGISFIMMVYPQKKVNASLVFSCNDSPICVIDPNGIDLFINTAGNLFIINSGRHRIIPEFIQKFCYLSLYGLRQPCECCQKI